MTNKLVPVEPTEEMLEAFCASMDRGFSRQEFQAAYKATLAAAPTAQAEPVTYEFQVQDGKWYPFIDERHYKNTVEDGSWPIRALFTHAPDSAAEITRLHALSTCEACIEIPAVGDYVRQCEATIAQQAERAREAITQAFNLGQTYWQQADSDSYSQNAKSDVTRQKLIDLRNSFALAAIEAHKKGKVE